jgi:hypothetical protein
LSVEKTRQAGISAFIPSAGVWYLEFGILDSLFMKPWRWLLLPHYLYFLALPSLALVATAMLGEQRGVGSLCLFGLMPVTVFIALTAYCYTVPRSLFSAIVYVFATPALVAAECRFGGGDVWRFIAQVTAIEIGAFAFALAYVELRERPLTQNSLSAALLLVLVLFLLLTNIMPFAVLAWRNLGQAAPLTLGLLAAAFIIALALHTRRLTAAVRDYKDTVKLLPVNSLAALTPSPKGPAPRLAGLEQALAATVVFLLIYLMTPMFSGFLLSAMLRR